MKDDNIGVTVLKKEFFRAIAVDFGGSGEELMKKIQKLKKIEDKVKEKVERKEKDWEEDVTIRFPPNPILIRLQQQHSEAQRRALQTHVVPPENIRRIIGGIMLSTPSSYTSF